MTGHGIAGNIREHYPRWLLYGIVGLLLGANIINLGADLGAMAAALTLLVGGPVAPYGIGFAIGCVALEVFSRYEQYVAIPKLVSRCWPTWRLRSWCTSRGGWCCIACLCRASH